MLGWFNALMPKEDRFFDLFERHAATLAAGAAALRELMNGGEGVTAACRRIAEHEHEADFIAAEVMTAVRQSFITPFDRSDIQALVAALDDAIDQMHKTAKAVTLYEVSSFQPHMAEIADTAMEAAAVTARALPLLRKLGANAGKLSEATQQLTAIEGRSDDLYDQGMKALYRASGERPMDFIVGAEIYDHLEKVLDRFEDVGKSISAIVVEHV